MKWVSWLGVAASLGLAATVMTPRASAQAVPGVAPAAPRNLWSFLLPTAEQKFACKTHFCNSPIGKMAAAAAGPAAAMSGGLIENRCLANAIEEALRKDAEKNPEESAAAAIKKSEAEAKARRAAVRYMSTADCRYFPEVTGVLTKALRSDTNECVRFEAALALGTGCCCNEKVVEALGNSVLGEDKKDDAPAERSDRVRAAAAEALARCAVPKETEEPLPNGKKKNGRPLEEEKGKEQASLPGTLHDAAPGADSPIFVKARLVLEQYRANGGAAAPTAAPAAQQQRAGSVAQILSGAFASNARPAAVRDEPAPARLPIAMPMPAAAPIAQIPEPKTVPALLTSQPLVPEAPEVLPGVNKPAFEAVEAVPAQPAKQPASAAPSRAVGAPVNSADRRPFFDSLTRSLKGKQTGRAPVTNIGTPVSHELAPISTDLAPVQSSAKIGVPLSVVDVPPPPPVNEPTTSAPPLPPLASPTSAAPPVLLPGQTNQIPLPR